MNGGAGAMMNEAQTTSRIRDIRTVGIPVVDQEQP